MASTPVSILNPGFDHENLLKNPLSIFDKSYSSNFTNFSICQQDSDEDRTSDEDQSEEDNSAEPIPEVFCNLKDIEVPIDNDIVFEVDENDSIKISSPGTCTGLRPGDILVSVNDRFIKSYSEGQTILHEEINSLHSKDSIKLRILVGKTGEEIENENKIQEETQRQKNSLFYATNFYSLSQDTHRKHHYHLSLQYVQKAYQLASSMTSGSPSIIKRMSKLMACCRELQGLNFLSLGQDIHSIEYFQDAINIRKRVYENDYHLSIYKSVDTLSRIYRRHSIFSQSLFYAQLLTDICNHNHLQHSSYMANALSNLAKIKKSQLLLNDSFLLEIESFQLRVMIHGYDHESIGQSLLAIGKIKQSLGDLGNGTEAIYHKAVQIYQNLIIAATNKTEAPPMKKSALATSLNSCYNHLGDTYSALSSFEAERKDIQKAESYKLQEIDTRQTLKHLTRPLLEAYWEYSEIIENTRSLEAQEFRLKAINGMKRLYGEKNKRLMKMMKEHEKKENRSPVKQLLTAKDSS